MKSTLLSMVLLCSLWAMGGSLNHAEARAKKKKFMLQILVQTPSRFAVAGVKVYADNKFLGATDGYGIFVGFIQGRVGRYVKIKVQSKNMALKRERRARFRTRTTDRKVVAEAIKMRFVMKGAKSTGKIMRFPMRVMALSPEGVGIGKARVLIDGKLVGRTNRYGIWVGSFRGQVGEVIQIKVVGRGKKNFATMPARLRTSGRRPQSIKFKAYIRP